MTFTDWPWRHWQREQPDAVALVLDGTPLSWHELCGRIDALAAGFYQQGVREGDGVALCARNRADTLLAWLALLQCGVRLLPRNPTLPAAQLETLLPGMTLRFSLTLDGMLPDTHLRALSLQYATGDGAAAWDPQRLATMTLTSGSSGMPKAAVHTAQAHLASAAGVLAMIPFSGEDRWLLSLPLFHVSGQGILWRWLLAGAQLAVYDGMGLSGALAGCSHASLVPTQLWRLLNDDGVPERLRAVLQGGATIPVELTHAAQQRGISCFCGYGMTELASTVCGKAADGLPDVGAPLAGREVRVVDNEVWIRAASMASGYWLDGALRPVTNAEGWFATRDRGYIADGRLTVQGRLDNLFFSAGEGIQPEEVERVIARLPGISQVFVVPVKDVEFGQRPVAVVEYADEVIPERLASWVKEQLARFQQPVHWLTLPETLKTGGIKISRRQLQEWVASVLA